MCSSYVLLLFCVSWSRTKATSASPDGLVSVEFDRLVCPASVQLYRLFIYLWILDSSSPYDFPVQREHIGLITVDHSRSFRRLLVWTVISGQW
jgi:hypothetical protein